MNGELQNISPESNLAFFLHDRLEPALRNADKIDLSPKLIAIYSSLDLLEAYFWLHLGVTIGYFPQPLARRVMYEYAVPVFKAHEAILETNLIDTWLPQPMRIILSNEFSGRVALLTIPEHAFASQIISLPVIFQNAFLLANGFAQQGEAARLVSAIALASDSMWQDFIVENQGTEFPSEDEHLIRLPEKGVGWSYQGFFQVLEYMKALPLLHRDAFPTFEKRAAERKPAPSPEVVSRERYMLERFFEQLREVQQWRFNFGYPTPRGRFLQITQSVAESLLKFTLSAETPEAVVLGFQREVYELLSYWGAPRTKSAGA